MTTPTRRVAATAALLALTACGGSQETIYFGAAGPLARANGKSMRKAVELAVDEINAQNPDGPRIGVVFMDDEANKEKAIDVAHRMRRSDSIIAVIGHVTSGTTIEAAEVYNAGADGESAAGARAGDTVSLAGTQPLVEISPASSADEISRLGPYTFRVVPTDSEHAPVLAQFISSLGRRRAAIVYSNDDYGRGVSTGFARAFRARGGHQVVSQDPYLPGVLNEADGAAPYLSRAFARGADALVIAGPADNAMGIIRRARALGFTGPIAGGDGLTSLKDTADAAGLYVSSAFLPDAREARAQKFVQSYQERYNELPDHRGAMAYDIVYLLYDAVKSGARDRAAIQRYLTGVAGGNAFMGITGRLEFDENGDAKGRTVHIGQVQNGRLNTVTGR